MMEEKEVEGCKIRKIEEEKGADEEGGGGGGSRKWE